MNYTHITEKKFFQIMLQLKQFQKMPPHFLLVIPAEINEEIVLKTTKLIICDQQGDCQPTCYLCQQIIGNNHDYFYHLTTEEALIKVDHLKPLLTWINYRPNHLKQRVYCLERMERLNSQGANKLLKFLETDIPQTIGILTTTNFSQLLPTIKSRLPTFILENSTFKRTNLIKLQKTHQLTAQDLEILVLFNQHQISLTSNFITKKYQNAKILFNQIWKIILTKQFDQLILMNEKLFINTDLIFFFNYCLIFWGLILKKNIQFKQERQIIQTNNIPLKTIFEITQQHYLKDVKFFHATKQHLTFKNIYLHWMNQLIRLSD